MEKLLELMRLDEPDKTGIIYPSAVVLAAVKDAEDRIALTNGILGECTPPIQEPSGVKARHAYIDLSRISHIVQHIWIENKRLMCKVKLLGQYAQVEDIMTLGFEGVARATGIIEGERERVCTEYTLITVDLSLPQA